MQQWIQATSSEVSSFLDGYKFLDGGLKPTIFIFMVFH